MIKPHKLAHLHSAPPSACDVALAIEMCNQDALMRPLFCFYFNQIHSFDPNSTEWGLSEIKKSSEIKYVLGAGLQE